MAQFFNSHRARICFGLVLATTALYWPVIGHDFINIDDPRFVTHNQHTQSGLTWPGICWAFQTVQTENWHPLTWISHMTDCQFFGTNAGGHHLTSLLLHVANTVLVFLLLEQMTGATWRSAFVAALFAWHPLHVESVAWVAERKDVLCAFFWLSSMMAYARYSKKADRFSYILSWLLFAAALMSKPMAVTLPFVLLLLDFWPLKRFQKFPAQNRMWTVATLAVEKIPFFALTLVLSIVTVFTQNAGGELMPLAKLPLQTRVASSLFGYVIYLSKTFWPSKLAVFYPYFSHFPASQIIGAALLLAALTTLCILSARQRPWLLVGWFWFLGTLIPVIGLVQVGLQSVADRYTYFPSLGLFIGVVWELAKLFSSGPRKEKLLLSFGGAALAGYFCATAIQLVYWQNSMTLAARAMKVTSNNYVAYDSMGRALAALGQFQRAVPFCAEAVRIEPDWPQGQFSLGIALGDIGRTNEAIEHLQIGVKLAPNFPDGRFCLGQMLMRCGKPDAAIDQFAEVLRLDPTYVDAQMSWGVVLATQGKIVEAIPHFTTAVRLKPNDPDMRFNLGLALLDNHQPAEAAAQFFEELRLTPNETRAHYRLAQALQQQGKSAEASLHYCEALRLTPNFPDARNQLAKLLVEHPELTNSAALDIPK